MAIAIDGTPVVQVGSTFVPTVTCSSVVIGSGSDRFLIAILAYRNDTTEPASVTYGGVAMTKISPATSPTISGIRIAAYGLDDPATGTANVVATSGQAEFSASMVAVGWTGVSGATGWNSATGTSTTPSVTISSVAAGEVTIDVLGALAGNIADSDASGTQIAIADTTVGGANGFGSSYDAGSTGSVAMNWTADLDDWVIGGFRLQVASAAATVPPPTFPMRFMRGLRGTGGRRAS